MKKLISMFLSTCVLISCITGCSAQPVQSNSTASGATPSSTAKPASEELVFWGYWDGEVEAQINEVVNAFNEKTGHKVKYVCQADMMNAFQAAALSNDVPDVMLWDATEVKRYARLNQLLPIDDYLASANIPSTDFNDEAIRELTVENKLYGLPMNLDIWGMYVNMDILRKAGIDKAPATWDEIKTAAIAAMEVEGVKVGVNMKMAPYLFNSFYYANNGQPLSEDGLTVNLDEKAVQVLDYFKELIDAKVYSTKYTAENGADGFLSGEEAMTFWPTSTLRSYKTYADEIDFTFMPIPKGRADGATSGGVQTSWSLVVPAASKHAEVAKEFLAFALHDPDNSLKWCDIVGGFSALKAVQNDDKFANDKYLKNILADLDNHRIRADIPGFINLEGTCYAPEIEKLFEGTQSAADTIKTMKTEGDKLLAQYRGDS